MQTLVVADVHGCHAELRRLIDLAGLRPGDRLVALGDAIDRGPDSVAVIDLLRTSPDARWLIGNHERKHVRSFRGETAAAASQRITRLQVGEDAYPALIGYLDALPLYLELPEAVLVHGFFEPGVPLEAQRETVIVGTLSGESYLRRTYERPWYELYDGPKPIVVGHRDYLGNGQPFVHRDRVFGIDTGCYGGGSLTGLLLPAFRLLSTPSPRHYWAETRARFAPALARGADPLDLEWEQLEAMHARARSAGPERLAGHSERLAAALREGEEALQRVETRVTAEHDRVLAELRASADYDALSERERARVYADAVRSHPIARLLHRARTGQIGPADVRRLLRTPRAAIEAAVDLNPAEATGEDGERRQE